MEFFPDAHAEATPDKPAYVMARTGEVVTYGQLTERSRRAAHLMRDSARRTATCVALLMENHLRYPRAGLGGAARRPALHGGVVAPDAPTRSPTSSRTPARAIVFASAATRGARRARRPGARSRRRQRRRLSYDELVADQPADAARRRARGRRLPLLVGHDRAAEGDRGDAPAGADRHAAGDRAAVRAALRVRRRHGVSLAGAAVPLGAAALQHGRAPARRDARS